MHYESFYSVNKPGIWTNRREYTDTNHLWESESHEEKKGHPDGKGR